MTFNQWCAGKSVDGAMRLALEAVWNEVADKAKAGRLLSDVLEAIPEPSEEDWDD